MTNSYKKELSVAVDIAQKAGVIMKKYFFAADQQLQRKPDDSEVTIADTTINRMVIEELLQHFTDGIIGEEESTSEYGMGRKWFCDPIDGTKAFTWGLPTAMFSLGLVVDGVPTLGVVYDPFLDLLYVGQKGNGSTCNGEPLQVSTAGLAGSCVAYSSSIEKLFDNAAPAKKLLAEKVRVAAFSGCVYKSSLIARGKFVGYFENGVNGHDIAAVQVIIEEAGGRVTDFNGKVLDYSKPFKGAVLSNGVVHDRLVEIANA